jgi:zinc/manganese transport system ATP-binding protein
VTRIIAPGAAGRFIFIYKDKNETQSHDRFDRVSERVAPAIELREAAVRIGGRTIWADVDLEVGAGEFVGLLGENGSGKSTLLKVLLGALALQQGEVRVLGGAPGAAGGAIGYLPQRPSFGTGIRLRGRDLVRLGLDGDRWGLPVPLLRGAAARRREASTRVTEAIELVGASGYAGRAIGECSGGEQQRLLIAQALVRRPRLLLLDEPLDSLDLPNQAAVSALVDRIRQETGVAVLLVAHDVNPLLPYLDRVAYLAGGRAVAGPVAEVITSETLSGLYGLPVEVLRASDGRLAVIGTPEAPAHHHDRHEHGEAHGHAH